MVEDIISENTLLCENSLFSPNDECLSSSSSRSSSSLCHEDLAHSISEESYEGETEVDLEVQLEADAESLISSSSDDNSERENIAELEFFRFSREGLSVYASLNDLTHNEMKESNRSQYSSKKNNSLDDVQNDSTLFVSISDSHRMMDTIKSENMIVFNCAMINFKELCEIQYPQDYSIGYYTKSSDRYNYVSLEKDKSEYLNEISNLANEKDGLCSKYEAQTDKESLNPSAFEVESMLGKAFHDSNSIRPLTQDRLSLVIQDIIYRINRQGLLADPEDICRKGGGNNGKYYDIDDDFIDDSIIYNANDKKNHSYPFYHSDKGSNSLKHNIKGQNEHSIEANSQDQSEDMDNTIILYDPSQFVFDNNPDNDVVSLIVYSEDSISDNVIQSKSVDKIKTYNNENEPIEECVQDNLISSSIVVPVENFVKSDTEGDFTNEYVSNTFWVKRKAWRDNETKISTEIQNCMIKLENNLHGKGSNKGLFVQPLEIVSICESIFQDLFICYYPKIPWDLTYFIEEETHEALIKNETVVTHSTPEGVHEEDYMVHKKTKEKSKIDLSYDTNSVILNEVSLDSFLPSSYENIEPISLSNSKKYSDNLSQNPGVVLNDTKIDDLDTEENANNSIDLKRKKHYIGFSTKADDFTPESIVQLTVSTPFQQLVSCIILVTNVLSKDIMNRWILTRLGIHNQRVYNALEDKIFKYISLKSPLFRRNLSIFFRNLKKAVDTYLHWLAKMKEFPTSKHNSNIKNYQSNEDQENSKMNKVVSPQSISDLVIFSVSDSPFGTVAIELLNWAIVYNSRRHELRELGEVLDEWTASFPTYVVDIFNKCIEKKQKNDQQGRSTSNKENLLTITPYMKKSRIWVPVKFMEETIDKFKSHFNVMNLYERRSKKLTTPNFVSPCKCLETMKNKLSSRFIKVSTPNINNNMISTQKECITNYFTPLPNTTKGESDNIIESSTAAFNASVFKAQKRKRKDIINFENKESVDTELHQEKYASSVKDKNSSTIKKKNKLDSSLVIEEAKLLSKSSIIPQKDNDITNESSVSNYSIVNSTTTDMENNQNQSPSSRRKMLVSKASNKCKNEIHEKCTFLPRENQPIISPTKNYVMQVPRPAYIPNTSFTVNSNAKQVFTNTEALELNNFFPYVLQSPVSNNMDIRTNLTLEQQLKNDINCVPVQLGNNQNLSFSNLSHINEVTSMIDNQSKILLEKSSTIPVAFPPYEGRIGWKPNSNIVLNSDTITQSQDNNPMINLNYYSRPYNTNMYNFQNMNTYWMPFNNQTYSLYSLQNNMVMPAKLFPQQNSSIMPSEKDNF